MKLSFCLIVTYIFIGKYENYVKFMSKLSLEYETENCKADDYGLTKVVVTRVPPPSLALLSLASPKVIAASSDASPVTPLSPRHYYTSLLHNYLRNLAAPQSCYWIKILFNTFSPVPFYTIHTLVTSSVALRFITSPWYQHRNHVNAIQTRSLHLQITVITTIF